MKAYDFEYDGHYLREFGFIICKFNDNGVETVSNGSNITFNTVSTMNGAKYETTSSKYDGCLTSSFQICKHPCLAKNSEITIAELREIMRWLNRKEFHKFKLLNDEYVNVFFEASFNVSKIELNGKIYGLELNMITNRPFALQEPIIVNLKNIIPNGEKRLLCKSDEEGFIYPEMEIVLEDDGDLEICNKSEGRTMRVANCKAGEVITISYPMIETSLSTHKIQNDFNWNFFRIINTLKSGENNITISLPCSIKLKYSPIIKVGI